MLMDANSGQILFAFNPDTKLPIASTTKIMTCLLALEQAQLDTPVVISENAVRVEGTRVYLEMGETQSIENLLYAAMLNSANDAAIALGEYLGNGSLESFSVMMNQRALEIGAINTNFVNPTGLTDTNHYSTAYDIALIAREAMNNPKFREIVATRTRPWVGEKYQTNLVNLNRLLWSYPGTTGIKTGYTRAAKNCLVASAEKDGHELISVILGGGNNIWQQSAGLLDYGFERYVAQTLVNKGEEVTTITFPKEHRVSLLASRSLRISLPRDKTANPQSQIWVKPDLKPPLAAGEVVGQLTYIVDDQKLESIPLILAEEVPASSKRPLLFIAGGLMVATGICWHLLERPRRLYYRRRKIERRNRKPFIS
ncbi:MAG: D-alanyl-D-alanine carboxypeptidase [Syntrophomonadaceae bacterium]|nr:D-alanyl-D-alanine carboxypeptidase [Syntrophomonadaceae bacterium]